MRFIFSNTLTDTAIVTVLPDGRALINPKATREDLEAAIRNISLSLVKAMEGK